MTGTSKSHDVTASARVHEQQPVQNVGTATDSVQQKEDENTAPSGAALWFDLSRLRSRAGAATELLLDEAIRLYSGRRPKHLQAVSASLQATFARLVEQLAEWRAGGVILEWYRSTPPWEWDWEWGWQQWGWQQGGAAAWAGAGKLWELMAPLVARSREGASAARIRLWGVYGAHSRRETEMPGLQLAMSSLVSIRGAIEAQPWAFALTLLFILITSLLLLLLPRGSGSRSPLSAAFFSLGLGYRDAKVLILGPDNSGKTTLMLMLKEGRVVIPTRTKAPNRTELVLGHTRLRAIDLGGHETARAAHPWEKFMDKTVGVVIFVVDAAAPARLPQARRELAAILQSDALGSRVPVVVLGNKIDLGVAMSEADLRAGLGLEEDAASNGGLGRVAVAMAAAATAAAAATTGAAVAAGGDGERSPAGKGSEGPRPVKVFMCSFVHKMGYGEGLVWMIDNF